MKVHRLTADEFDEVVFLSRLGDNTRALAKRHLVDQVSISGIALEFGVPRQRVSNAVELVRRVYEDRDLDVGLVVLDVEVPGRLAKPLDQFLQGLASVENPKMTNAAIDHAVDALTQCLKNLEVRGE